jgi:exodeoxyribonuclease-3
VEHEDYGRKLAWFDGLVDWTAEQLTEAESFALVGDFNIVPAPIDSWNEEKLGGGIFHTEEERARFAKLRGLGLADLWRSVRPEDPGHSWWDYRAGAFHKRMGLRIDILLATEALRARTSSVGLERTWRKKIEGLTPSDHAPVWADLD